MKFLLLLYFALSVSFMMFCLLGVFFEWCGWLGVSWRISFREHMTRFAFNESLPTSPTMKPPRMRIKEVVK